MNTGTRNYEFTIHRKNAITNVQLKPHSYVNTSLITSIFKGFLSRAKKICSEKYLNDEVKFLIDMYVENGHDRIKLTTLANSYVTKSNTTKEENTDDNINIITLPWVRL